MKLKKQVKQILNTFLNTLRKINVQQMDIYRRKALPYKISP